MEESGEERAVMAKGKYETHVLPCLDRIADWAERGATAKEIAKKLGIAYSTFRKYLDEGEKGDERYAALAAAFARACEVPDDEIETALFQRAKGIEYEEKTFELKLNKETGQMEEVCSKRVTKFIPPDPTSAMFWLTNRRPDRWSYKPENRGGGDGDGGIIFLAPVDERLQGGGGDG